MDEENSNPEPGELSDDAAAEMLAAMRAAPAVEAEAETEEAEEAETEEAEADAEDEPEAEEEPELFSVKVDGEEVRVTREELLNGYQRDADYRRKTQSLAEDRKAVEAEKTRQREITASLIAEHQKLAGNDEPEPDWVKLATEDPIGFIQQKATWDARQARKEQARQQTAQLVNQQRAEIAGTEAAKLRDKVPEWRDPETFSRDFQSLVSDAGKFYGFAADEVGAVLDHRTLMVLKDAAEFRRLQAKKSVVEKKVAQAPKSVVKPGSVAGKAALSAQDLDAVRNRFRRSGSDDDAVALLRAKRT